MVPAIRRLEDADVEAVVALSLRAWAPVFASLAAQLGPEVDRLLFPDRRAAQAAAVEATCRAPEHRAWVAEAGGRPVGFVVTGLVDEDAARAGEVHRDPGHAPARALYERLGFAPLPLVRYYRTLGPGSVPP